MKSKKTKQIAPIKEENATIETAATTWSNTSLEETYMDLHKEQAVVLEKLQKAEQEATFWKTKAQLYGEKFGQALKGFLLYEGKHELFAERERQKVLKDVQLI